MSFSEFIAHPTRSTDFLNTTQITEILSHNAEENSDTDTAQQKQRKQLILADRKNIFT